MKNKQPKNFTKQFFKMILPEEWFEIFDLAEVIEKRKEWNLVLTEKTELVPTAIKEKSWVLNGYCKPLELMTFPAGGKPVYIKIGRRKWKEEGGRESYTNTYDLHYPGVKATKPFADFLKGLDRNELNEFFNAWPVYRRMREKDTSLVQRLLKRFQRRGRAKKTP